jgi:SET domain-containing protein
VFTVATVVRSSPIQGVGVFAAQFIPAGTNIWDFTPGVDWKLTPEEVASFPQPFQARLRRYCYLDESGVYVLCGDNAKFMNHSEDPNCDDGGSRTRAIRDIQPGEELTCNYRLFDVEFDGSEFLSHPT